MIEAVGEGVGVALELVKAYLQVEAAVERVAP